MTYISQYVGSLSMPKLKRWTNPQFKWRTNPLKKSGRIYIKAVDESTKLKINLMARGN